MHFVCEFTQKAVLAVYQTMLSLKVEPVAAWRRTAARLHQLDELAKRVHQLEAEINKLAKEQKT